MLMYSANGPVSGIRWPASMLLLLIMGLLTPLTSMAEDREIDSRPSILIVVMDTVRRDAVSAYGGVADTTPNFDRLAEKGVRYTRAFSSAPWTVPSHASLFTGRTADQHRLSMPGVNRLPLEFETLAEQLSEAGYETAAFAENITVSDAFDLLRGFDVRESSGLAVVDDYIQVNTLEASEAFQSWIAGRDTSRPFFAFVNVMDAHTPYPVHDENPWVPESASKHLVTDRPLKSHTLLCGALPPKDQLGVLRGLYLGGVHDADRKLGEVVAAARDSLGGQRLITLVTSDHGELFGEDHLLGHEFSVNHHLLAIPLVVSGLKSLKPTVIKAPVGLVDVMPTILEWVGIDRPADLPGRLLPMDATQAEAAPARTFFSSYTDQFSSVPEKWEGKAYSIDKDLVRQFCVKSNRVFGAMASLIRYPFKYVWYERYAPSLYDLSWDPNERSDQLKYKSDLAESFAAEMKKRVEASRITEPAPEGSEMSEEALKRLKELGYVH
ncbi:MAG TPA: hypothetical protein EYQ60_12425 [Myxococcales bacterium]|nr:hypothetical protein [Myxococcales bacterium]HIK83931.1 hypothetical protein [Myxococcales bacterium]